MRRVGNLLAYATAVAVGLVVVFAFSRATYPLGPIAVTVSLEPAWPGETILALPPLGSVAAETHAPPVRLRLTPARLRIHSPGELLERVRHRERTLARIQKEARAAARRYAIRLGLLAVAGGAAGALLAGLRRPRQVVGVSLGCLVLVAAAGGGLWLTFDRKAFESPRYTGLMAAAPQAMAVAREWFTSLEQLGEQLRKIAANLAQTYATVTEHTGSLEGVSIRVLHVTDLHNNPAGMDLTLALARSYRVDAVICTGDLTDFGSAVENRIVERWKELRVPKVFVLGNHDSQATAKFLEGIPGAIVLADGQPVTIAGLRMVGWNSPVANRPGFGEAQVTGQEIARLIDRMRAQLAGMTPPADLVLVHNYRAARACAGLAPVFAFGHNHRPRVWKKEGSWLVNAGTTGAAGLRRHAGESPPPFSAAILYFARGGESRLEVVDLVELRHATGKFTVDRTRVPGGARQRTTWEAAGVRRPGRGG